MEDNQYMDDDQNVRRPKWKTTKTKDDQNGRRPKWKTTKMEHDQNGRRPKWKTTKMESNQNGTRPKWRNIKIEDNKNVRRLKWKTKRRFKAYFRFAGFLVPILLTTNYKYNNGATVAQIDFLFKGGL